GGEHSQAETAPVDILQQLSAALLKCGEQQAREDAHADPAEVQIGLDVSVVCLHRVPPPPGPHILQAWAEPEAFESSAQHRIDVHLQDVVPHLSAIGERGVTAEELNNPAVDAESRFSATDVQNDHHDSSPQPIADD